MSNKISPFHTSRSLNFVKLFANREYLKLLIEVAYYRHPTNTTKRLKLLLRSLFWFRQTFEWHKQISTSPLLSALVLTHKGLVEKPHKCYLRMDYSINERLTKLINHYSIFTSRFEDHLIQQIVFGKGLSLARIEISPEDVFGLTLTTVDDECKEGELAIRLHRPNEPELAILRFSFLPYKNGINLYIGGIQGPRGIGSKEKIKNACKALSGLSPNRLVLESCLALANCLKVDQVLVVSDKQQVFKNKHNKHFSYDVFCSELEGRLNQNGDYQLPLFIERKKREDTPCKRRAKYQRKHALLDAVYKNTLLMSVWGGQADLCGPLEPQFNQTWQPGDIEPVQ
ncbi:MAG: DUF535 family protein [Methylococcales bacterium]|nr:DUF535 family protein [Methylococcales bacterium]